MSTITLPNIRVSSDLTVRVRLKDGGVAIDWSTLTKIKASIYSDAQRALAGRCGVSIDAEDSTLLVCSYAANKPQYVGVNRIVVSAKYMGETKTYDKPAFNFVRWTADQEGEEITIDDPDVDVEIEVTDATSSILDNAIAAALKAAEDAERAAHLVPLEVLQDCVEATGEANQARDDANEAAAKANLAASKAPYIGENGNWYVWDAENGEYIDSGVKGREDIDDALSDSSTNPVENRVVKAALDSKQATIVDLQTIRAGAAAGASAAVRPYNSQSPDGMGYLVLEKDKTFAEQVTGINKVYEIRYDFSLGGSSVTLPSNCVLKFNGGSITNGTLVGDNTKIDAPIVKIFGTDVTISGNWTVDEAYPEWFGTIGGSYTVDARPGIQKCIDSFYCTKFTKHVYNILSSVEIDGKQRGIIIPGFKKIIGVNNDLNECWIRTYENLESVFYLDGGHVEIDGLFISGGGVYPNHGEDGLAKYGIESKEEVAYFRFRNVHIRYCYSHGFKIHAFIVRFDNCTSSNCQGDGFHIEYTNGRGTTLQMGSCYAHECVGNGYNIVNMAYSNLTSCACDKCGYSFSDPNFDHSTSGYAYRLENCNSVSLLSCGFEDCFNAYSVTNLSTAIVIAACRGLLAKNNDYNMSKAIYLDYSFGVSLINCFVTNEANVSAEFVSLGDGVNTMGKNIIIQNCYTNDANGYRTKLSYANCVQKTGFVFIGDPVVRYDGRKLLTTNLDGDTRWTGFLHGETTRSGSFIDIINLSNYVYDKPIIYTLNTGSNYCNSPSTIENINSRLSILVQDGASTTIYHSKNIFTISNCQEIIISGVTIAPSYSEAEAITSFIRIVNSRVIFKKCAFQITRFLSVLTSVYDAKNSEIIFEDCTFTNPSNIPLVSIDTSNVVMCIKDGIAQSFPDGIWRAPVGTSANRPTLAYAQRGFVFFDDTLAKSILWNGVAWVNIDGTALS